MGTIPKVRPPADPGQAAREQKIVLPVPRLTQLQALEGQAGAIRLGLDDAGTLGHTLNGLVGRVLEDVHCIRLSRLQCLHVAQREPREIAFAVLSEGRA